LDSRKDITDTIFMAMVRNHLQQESLSSGWTTLQITTFEPLPEQRLRYNQPDYTSNWNCSTLHTISLFPSAVYLNP
jgi:hypothetical protein